MSEPSNNVLTWLIGGLSFFATSTFLGWLKFWKERDKPEQEGQLIVAQTEQTRATTDQIRTQTIVESMQAHMVELRADVARLREDRDIWRARSEAAEKQLALIQAQKTIDRLTDN